jgi:hypothetical protein
MKHVLLKGGAIQKLYPCVQGWCDFIIHRPSSSQRHGRRTLVESISLNVVGTLNVLRVLCLTRSFEIKKSLSVLHDLPNDDDAQKVEEIFFLKFYLPWMERGLLVKKKFAAKTSTTGVSKKSRAIVDSVVDTESATVEDTLMGEADSEPFNPLKVV